MTLYPVSLLSMTITFLAYSAAASGNFTLTNRCDFDVSVYYNQSSTGGNQWLDQLPKGTTGKSIAYNAAAIPSQGGENDGSQVLILHMAPASAKFNGTNLEMGQYATIYVRSADKILYRAVGAFEPSPKLKLLNDTKIAVNPGAPTDCSPAVWVPGGEVKTQKCYNMSVGLSAILCSS